MDRKKTRWFANQLMNKKCCENHWFIYDNDGKTLEEKFDGSETFIHTHPIQLSDGYQIDLNAIQTHMSLFLATRLCGVFIAHSCTVHCTVYDPLSHLISSFNPTL